MQDYSGDVQSFRVCKKNTWTAKVTQEKFLSPHLQEYKQMKCQNYYDYASVLSWVVDFMAAFAICNAVLLPRSANCDWIDNRKLWSWQLQLAAGQYGTGNFICSPLFFFIDGECAWRQKYISIYSMQHIWLCSAWSWTIFTDVWYASHCLLHWTNDKWCSGIDTTKQRAVCCAQVKVVLKLQCKVEVMSSEVGSVCLKPIGLKAMRRIPFEGQECAMLENLWGSQSKV